MGLVKSLQIYSKGSKQKKMNDVSVLVYACLCCFSPAVGAESVVPVSGGGAQVCKSVLLLVSGGSWKGFCCCCSGETRNKLMHLLVS